MENATATRYAVEQATGIRFMLPFNLQVRTLTASYTETYTDPRAALGALATAAAVFASATDAAAVYSYDGELVAARGDA